MTTPVTAHGVVNIPVNSLKDSSEFTRAMSLLRTDRAATYAKFLRGNPCVTMGLAVSATGVGLQVQVDTGEGFDGNGLPIWVPPSKPSTLVPFGQPAEGVDPKITLAAAHASLARIDLVYLRANTLLTDYDSVLTSNAGAVSMDVLPKTKLDYFTLDVVHGTPNASPVAPSPLLGTDLVLAYVTVPAAAVTLNAGNVADARLMASTVLPRPLAPKTLTSGTSYTANASELVLLNLASPAPFTLTLPAGSDGDVVQFKDLTGALARNPVTLSPASGTIEGQSSVLVTLAGVELTLYKSGTKWVFI